jgi:hypothetical protein
MTSLKPLRVKVSRDLTLLMWRQGDLIAATVEGQPRIQIKASTVALAAQGAREGLARLGGGAA